jgi:hypothetical protein
MAIHVQRHPLNGKAYRALSVAQIVSLVVGVPLVLIVLVMAWTGNGSGPVMNVLLYGLLLPAFVVFALTNSFCRIYYDRDAD